MIEARPEYRTDPTDAATAAWQEVLDTLQPRMVGASIMWFLAISCVGERDKLLVLQADRNHRGWIKRRYGKLIGETIRQVTDYRGCLIEPPEHERLPMR